MKKLILITVVISTVMLASSGGDLIQQNRCMDCHNIMGKKSAPAFMGTARKNIKWYGDDAKSKIIDGIKKGSKGKYPKFKDTQMPAFDNLSSKDLDTMATWILDQYTNNPNRRQGKSGQDGRR